MSTLFLHLCTSLCVWSRVPHYRDSLRFSRIALYLESVSHSGRPLGPGSVYNLTSGSCLLAQCTYSPCGASAPATVAAAEQDPGACAALARPAFFLPAGPPQRPGRVHLHTLSCPIDPRPHIHDRPRRNDRCRPPPPHISHRSPAPHNPRGAGSSWTTWTSWTSWAPWRPDA